MPESRRVAIDTVDNVKDVWIAFRFAGLLAKLERRGIIEVGSFRAFEGMDHYACLGVLTGIKQMADEYPGLFKRGPLIVDSITDPKEAMAHYVQGSATIYFNLADDLFSNHSFEDAGTRLREALEVVRHEIAHFGMDQLTPSGQQRLKGHLSRRTPLGFPDADPKTSAWVARRLTTYAATDEREMIAEAISVLETQSSLARNARRGLAEFFGPNMSNAAYRKYTAPVQSPDPQLVHVNQDGLTALSQTRPYCAGFMGKSVIAYVSLQSGQVYRISDTEVVDVSASSLSAGVVSVPGASVDAAVVGLPLREPDPFARRRLDNSPITSVVMLNRFGNETSDDDLPSIDLIRQTETKLYLAGAKNGVEEVTADRGYLIRECKPPSIASSRLREQNPWLMTAWGYTADGNLQRLRLRNDNSEEIEEDANYVFSSHDGPLNESDFEYLELWDRPPLTETDLEAIAHSCNVLIAGRTAWDRGLDAGEHHISFSLGY